MIKTNLPVIILNGIILLPNNEIRLEFDNDGSKGIIEIAELFHENKILVVTKTNPIEETIQFQDLPEIGVLASVNHKMELPNGKTRLTITGIKRTRVLEYLNIDNNNNLIEAITEEIEIEEIDKKEEITLTRKLYHEMENYIKNLPYVSNSILSIIVNVNSLDKMTDLIIPNLQLQNDRVLEYLNTVSAVERLKMILEDLYSEVEMFNIEKDLDSKIKKELDSNQKEYLLRQKIKLIKEELNDATSKDDEIDILNQKIENLNAPDNIKKRLKSELKRYETMTQSSPEVNIVRNYIDWLLKLPWNNYTVDNDDLQDVRKKLNLSHSGLESVKTRIIEYLAVKQMTNSLRGPIICLVGPPGVGKTSLAFSIAKAMNRNFVKISVGGIHDEAELVGHRKTYLGASPGRIIQSLKKAKSSNPVFLIDEIDKMSKDYKGDPASILLEVLDPEQNKYFSDNYIEEEYDLSNIMFIATANYLYDIPEALRDRLEVVELSGYTEYEKIDIAKKYLLPKICKDHGVNCQSIDLKDDIISKIIRNYTKESGVRELERQLSKIVRKIITEIVNTRKLVNRYIIDSKKMIEFLGKEKYQDNHVKASGIGVVNGLAYTSFGGDILPIEVNYFKGHGNLVLTGSLGDVMKESALIALDYIKANHKYFEINIDSLLKNDIHIHVPEGAIPKDGPSAGIALTTAIISMFSRLKVSPYLAMTGEITLRGNVLAIGGLREKSIGAHRNGIKKIIIPINNVSDLEEVPNEVKKDIEYITVKDYKEVFRIIKEEV